MTFSFSFSSLEWVHLLGKNTLTLFVFIFKSYAFFLKIVSSPQFYFQRAKVQNYLFYKRGGKKSWNKISKQCSPRHWFLIAGLVFSYLHWYYILVSFLANNGWWKSWCQWSAMRGSDAYIKQFVFSLMTKVKNNNIAQIWVRINVHYKPLLH